MLMKVRRHMLNGVGNCHLRWMELDSCVASASDRIPIIWKTKENHIYTSLQSIIMPGTKNKQNVPGRFARNDDFKRKLIFPLLIFLHRVVLFKTCLFSNFMLHNFRHSSLDPVSKPQWNVEPPLSNTSQNPG